MTRTTLLGLGLSALAACLFAGCASTTLTSSWKDPEYTGGSPSKVLVIGVAQNAQRRRLFEDAFVRRLQERGTDALASYRVFGAEGMLTRERVEAELRSSDIDAVLVTRLVGSKTEIVHHPETVRVDPRVGGWHRYYAGSYEITRTPASTSEFTVLSLESNLFDKGTGKPIWSASFETVPEGSVEDVIKSFVDAALKSLEDEQLVR